MSDYISMYSLTHDDLVGNANIAKEVVIGALYNQGILTAEQYDDLVKHWAVVIVNEKPTFGSRIRQVFGYDKDHPKGQQTYTMVKFLSGKEE